MQIKCRSCGAQTATLEVRTDRKCGLENAMKISTASTASNWNLNANHERPLRPYATFCTFCFATARHQGIPQHLKNDRS
jgi:hypothetical protein